MVYNYEDERFTFMKLESLRSKYGREWSHFGKGCDTTYLTKSLPNAIVQENPQYDAFAWGCAKSRLNYFLSYILRRRITPKISHFYPLKIRPKLDRRKNAMALAKPVDQRSYFFS